MGYDHITRDLARKAADDAVDATKRAIALSDKGHGEAATIALMASGTVLAIAVAKLARKLADDGHEQVSAPTVVDALFEQLRPIVLDSIEASKSGRG